MKGKERHWGSNSLTQFREGGGMLFLLLSNRGRHPTRDFPLKPPLPKFMGKRGRLYRKFIQRKFQPAAEDKKGR